MNKNTYLIQKDENKIYLLPDIKLEFEKYEVNKITNLYENRKKYIQLSLPN